jgi:glycosyltransferase involved in cell wall biosynthesis
LKILVVAPQPFFTPRGTPFSVYYRTKVTCELGHEVDLLTYGQGEDVEIAGCRIVRIPAFRWLGPVRVGPSMLKLFLDCFMVLWTIGLLLRHRYDAVHAHEEAIFWCRWLKPVFRFKFIHDMHSSLPQQLDNFQYTRLRIIHWIFDRFERSAARSAEAVITVCPALFDYARTLTTDHDKVFLIENSLFDPVILKNVDETDSDGPGEEELARVRMAEQWLQTRNADQVIAYAGTLEVYQGIDRLLEAFSVVATQMPDAGLLIVGGTPQEVEHFRSLAAWLSLGSEVHFSGQVSQAQAQRLVGLTAASVSPRFAGNNTPMKVYHLMSAGIPLVATRIESHTQVLNDDIAILADVSTGALAEAILKALGDAESARAVAARAQEWYREHYSRDAYKSKMQKLFSRVG